MYLNPGIMMTRSVSETIHDVCAWWSHPFEKNWYIQMWKYFTIWTLFITGMSMILPSIQTLAYIHKIMAIQASAGGAYITYVYPKRLIVPYCRIEMDGIVLQTADFLSHHLPLIIAFIRHPIPAAPPSIMEKCICLLPLFVFNLFFPIEELYHLRRTDIPILFALMIISSQIVFMESVWMSLRYI